MKYLFTFLFLYSITLASANTRTFNKLSEVNTCWKEQLDINVSALPVYQNLSETEWIRLHLSLVEHTLRNRVSPVLTATQRANRLNALDHLHEYWMAGRFPQNENYTFRTPIFIDKHNIFCAVGYLVKTSGHEDISRMIAAKTNLAYVKEMHYFELDRWAADNGFTKDELAWIQPGYPPSQQAQKVGNGVDGEVQELYADNAGGKLYVGGTFVNVDSTIEANNIAYVTEQNNVITWHSMGSGTNGPVYAIAAYENKIFVAGHFSEAGGQGANNIAYWDGTAWHAAGCTFGTIYDLIVYKNELYACGSFDVCAAMSDVNVAKWNGTLWQQMPGLSGKVNTMEVMGDDLLLGGAFTFGTEAANVVRWNESQYYHAFGNSIPNEVKDFEWHRDTLYAACKQTSPSQLNSSLFQFIGGSWIAPDYTLWGFTSMSDVPAFNSLCVDNNNLMIGGNFNYSPGVGIFANNCVALEQSVFNNGNWFLVDSAINKLTLFKGALFAGGKFKHGGEMVNTVLNGMARRGAKTGIPDIVKDYRLNIFPNPVDGNTIFIENNFEANSMTLTDISGKSLLVSSLQTHMASQQVSLPQMSQGIYLLSIGNAKGEKVVKKLVIK
jgi:hypothetical protein